MTCLEVRELLPELAVGVLAPAERDEVERHLRWCAGCRKEASELGSAAATFAYVLAPAPVPHGLGERIVDRVHRAAGAPGTARRVRTVAASMVAAMVAVASLSYGAAMAGRADRYEERAAEAERDRAKALAQFEKTLVSFVPNTEFPDQHTHLGELRPTAAGQGGGSVLQLVSPTRFDFNLVILGGLSKDPARFPYSVRLVNAAGQVLKAGRIDGPDALDADGKVEIFHEYANADLTGFTIVRVIDGTGAVVLAGEVDQG